MGDKNAPVPRSPGSVHCASSQKKSASERRVKSGEGRDVSGSIRLWAVVGVGGRVSERCERWEIS